MTKELIESLSLKHFSGVKNLEREVYKSYEREMSLLETKYSSKRFNVFFPLLEIWKNETQYIPKSSKELTQCKNTDQSSWEPGKLFIHQIQNASRENSSKYVSQMDSPLRSCKSLRLNNRHTNDQKSYQRVLYAKKMIKCWFICHTLLKKFFLNRNIVVTFKGPLEQGQVYR